MSDSPNPTSHPLRLGVAWHPEHWPDDQWPLDIARMKELGVTCVRLFESAWHRFEPREWEFDFDWAVRILDQLKEAGIGAILATPTAAPPAWMCAKYPEVLRVTPDGRRVTHGHDRPYSVVSSRYREFCSRVVDQMVHAFRGHDAVIGWQIDDRISGADYGNEARRAFHNWLHERFGQVESLNSTWGLELGSQAYEYFEQISIPAAPHGHPSLMIAFNRFINDQWSSFIQTQCEMIRAGFDKPISTNMTANLGMNYFRQNHLLDRVGMTLRESTCATSGSLQNSLINLDRMRAEKPGIPFWTLGAPDEGREAISMAWLSTLMGSELHLLHHWREPWAGPEMGAGGLVTPTGRWSAHKDAIATLANQFKSQADYLHLHPPIEARVAVVMSNESAWAFCVNPPEPDFDYESIWRDEFHLSIAQSHYWRDVIDQTADFCPYNVIVMPLVPIVFRPTKERLKEWVQEGGCLLLGPLTGHRTEEFTAWTDHEFGGLEDLIGATCTGHFTTGQANDTMILWGTDPKPMPEGEGPPQPSVASILADAEKPPVDAGPAQETSAIPISTPRGLCHAFIPTTAHVLARYQTQGTTQDAAILINKVGQGTVITLGARVDQDSYLDLIHTLCELAKIEPLATGSSHVAVIPRMNPDSSVAAYGIVNLTNEPQTIALPSSGLDRLTGRDTGAEVNLQPMQVMLVEVSSAPKEQPPI